ncbi:MAG: hypothetical protein U0271_04885 [Polyangiaceae bacterium]
MRVFESGQGRARAALLPLVLLAAAGCGDDANSNVTVARVGNGSRLEKLDVLLVVDNSIGMADKQALLAQAMPDLLNQFWRPTCLDDAGQAVGVADEAGACAVGKPQFQPVKDINIGLITSSLGDLTSGACGSPSVLNADDKAHLVWRSPSGGSVSTYQDKGFLAWDPDALRGGDASAPHLADAMADLVSGADQLGCGYEMPLEAMARFLVDPSPYASLTRNGNLLEKGGVDDTILAERRDFLRPDAALAIVLVSDENDCSVNVSGQGFLALGGTPFFRSTSECETDPESPCCTSCGLDHTGCDAGGSCDLNNGQYAQGEDNPNLKCWDQKRRYGVDLLYPVARYVNALSRVDIDPDRSDFEPTDGSGVPNPLFQDSESGGPALKGPADVIVLGIVGVPWQALARRNGAGAPDASLGMRTFEELGDDLAALVGDPDAHEPPSDPFMRESMTPRSGASTIVGASLPGDNPVNGRDYNVFGQDDLQFACIFPLATPISPGPDCSDCTAANGCNNPLCDGVSMTQVATKAYPGLRELAVLEGLGPRAAFASVCPAELDDTNSPAYGYRPAIGALAEGYARSASGGSCLETPLPVDDAGDTSCHLVEAAVNSSCSCDGVIGRAAVAEGSAAYKAVEQARSDGPFDCFCEVTQLTDNDREQCRSNPAIDPGISGWCYLDLEADPPIGAAALVQDCDEGSQRTVRLVGARNPNGITTLYLACEAS